MISVSKRAGQRVRPAPSARQCLLRRQPRILLAPIARRRAEPGLGRRQRHPIALSVSHEQPHLVVVDVSAGHSGLPLWLRNPVDTRPARPPVARLSNSAPPAGGAAASGYALRRHTPGRPLILIVADSHPDCRAALHRRSSHSSRSWLSIATHRRHCWQDRSSRKAAATLCSRTEGCGRPVGDVARGASRTRMAAWSSRHGPQRR